MQIKNSLFLFLMCLVLLLSSCKRSTAPQNDQPPVQQPEPFFTLTLQDSTCTEVWLRLSTDSTYLHKNFILKRDAKIVDQFTLKQNDTLLYDENLQPAQTYNYQVFVQDSLKILDSSNVLTATTMDTTSHDFEWKLIEFTSPFGSGYWRDVAIIDENDIWVVGAIYKDSMPYEPYNAAHWNGNKWELKRIYYYWHGSKFINPIPSIYAFNKNDIWFGNSTKWDGKTFVSIPLNIQFPSQPNNFWGSSSNDLYIIGYYGLMAHYDGERWEKLNTGIDYQIQDIWGAYNEYSKKFLILAVASEKYYDSEKSILNINPETKTVQKVIWAYQNRRIHSIWFKNDRRLWICGAGVFYYKNNQWIEFKELPLIFKNRIRGTNNNNIFVVGDFGFVAHFNGMSWKRYPEVSLPLYHSVDVKGNMMVAVGESGSSAYVLIMKK